MANRRRILSLLAAGLLCLTGSAQPAVPGSMQKVDMADTFYSEGKVYIVVVVVSLVVAGMVLYLFVLDRKLAKLERKIEEK